MKRKTFTLCLLAALCGTAFVGCQKDNLSGQSHNTIITVLPGNAKTHLNPADYSVKWDEGDQISVSRGNTTTTNAFSTFTLLWPLEQNGEARFAGDITATEGIYYAIYPAQQNLSVSGETLTCEPIRTHQTLTPGTFGRGDNTAVGYNDNTTMRFRNVGGLAKLTLSGAATVKSVRITNNATTGNTLSGRGTIDLIEDDYSLPIEWASTGTYNYVEATAADGIDVNNPTIFYIVLPPCTLSNYTITIKDADGNTIVDKTITANPVTISRATITTLGQFNVEPYGPASNQIWYTTTDNNAIAAFNTATTFCTSGTLVSNAWDSDKNCFVATYTTDVTMIPTGCLRDAATLKSVTFPEGPTEVGYRAFYNDPSLSSVTLPLSVVLINGGVFTKCPALHTLDIPNPNAQIVSDYTNSSFSYSGLDTLILHGSTPFNYLGTIEMEMDGFMIEQTMMINGLDFNEFMDLYMVSHWNPFEGAYNTPVDVYVPDATYCRNLVYQTIVVEVGYEEQEHTYDYKPWKLLEDINVIVLHSLSELE